MKETEQKAVFFFVDESGDPNFYNRDKNPFEIKKASPLG